MVLEKHWINDRAENRGAKTNIQKRKVTGARKRLQYHLMVTKHEGLLLCTEWVNFGDSGKGDNDDNRLH